MPWQALDRPLGSETGTGGRLGQPMDEQDGWFAGLVFDRQGKACYTVATFVRRVGLGAATQPRSRHNWPLLDERECDRIDPAVGKWRLIPDRPPSCGQIAPTPLIAGNRR